MLTEPKPETALKGCSLKVLVSNEKFADQKARRQGSKELEMLDELLTISKCYSSSADSKEGQAGADTDNGRDTNEVGEETEIIFGSQPVSPQVQAEQQPPEPQPKRAMSPSPPKKQHRPQSAPPSRPKQKRILVNMPRMNSYRSSAANSPANSRFAKAESGRSASVSPEKRKELIDTARRAVAEAKERAAWDKEFRPVLATPQTYFTYCKQLEEFGRSGEAAGLERGREVRTVIK